MFPDNQQFQIPVHVACLLYFLGMPLSKYSYHVGAQQQTQIYVTISTAYPSRLCYVKKQ
jgi:hypothetical protein